MTIRYVIAETKRKGREYLVSNRLPMNTPIITNAVQLYGVELFEGEFEVVGALSHEMMAVAQTRIRDKRT